MPVPLPADFLAMQTGIENKPYPANTRQATGPVGGTNTNVTVINFTDKIMVTIIQNGRLAQWVLLSIENLFNSLALTYKASCAAS